MHLVLALTVVAFEWAWLASGPAFALVALHAWLGYPRCTVRLLLECDGAWAVPAEQRYDLRLGPATAYTYEWVSLSLESRGTEPALRVLLLRDQLDAQAWRRLQQRLRAKLIPSSFR